MDCWSPQLLLHGPEKALGGCVISCLFVCQGSWGLVLAGQLKGESERSIVIGCLSAVRITRIGGLPVVKAFLGQNCCVVYVFT